MKILFVHNAYQRFGGEDAVVAREAQLLRDHLHDVDLYAVSNDVIVGVVAWAKAALGLIFSLEHYQKIRLRIRTTHPDVVHVHNFFPLISPAVFYACVAEKVPVVFTLHNYRTVCPTATLELDGKETLRSLESGPWWALGKPIYRNSRLGTTALCAMIGLHHHMGTWKRLGLHYVTPSVSSRDHFIRAGFPASHLFVKPHFVDIEREQERARAGFIYVGRLSPEKGVDVLIDACHRASAANGLDLLPLRVVGEGPLAERCQRAGMLMRGRLKPKAVVEEMRGAAALIVPSVCQETFGLVIIEAFACGLPVIASRIGAFPELVEDGVTGLLFEPGNAGALAAILAWADANPNALFRMGIAARRRYEKLYSAEVNLRQLTGIYEDAIRDKARSKVQ